MPQKLQLYLPLGTPRVFCSESLRDIPTELLAFPEDDLHPLVAGHGPEFLDRVLALVRAHLLPPDSRGEEFGGLIHTKPGLVESVHLADSRAAAIDPSACRAVLMSKVGRGRPQDDVVGVGAECTGIRRIPHQRSRSSMWPLWAAWPRAEACVASLRSLFSYSSRMRCIIPSRRSYRRLGVRGAWLSKA